MTSTNHGLAQRSNRLGLREPICSVFKKSVLKATKQRPFRFIKVSGSAYIWVIPTATGMLEVPHAFGQTFVGNKLDSCGGPWWKRSGCQMLPDHLNISLGYCTVSVILVECVNDPDEPVILIVYVPGGVPLEPPPGLAPPPPHAVWSARPAIRR